MFTPEQADYTDPQSILPDWRLTNYMDNEMELNTLRDFLVVEGTLASPELHQIDATIEAQKRSITQAKREFWVPTVSLVGNVTETFSKSGAGSEYPAYRDDTDWSVGIQVSLPLFKGGGKKATLIQSREELLQLQHERDSTANKIEEQIFNAIHQIRASYPGIRLSNDAADAARRNLTLVTDSYSRGVKSIIDLIDAQNQVLVASQQAANALYDFLIDIMALQRSTGSFFLFAPQAERDAFMERLEWFRMSH
jgi:outer membrane protein TolC